MPNPTPIYVVTYNDQQLPGYVQSDDRPLNLRYADDTVFGRDGIVSTFTGANARDISLTFLIKSTLGSNSTGLQHLDNLMDQYRTAKAILTRSPGMKELMIHDSDRYYLAKVDSVSMPMQATQSRSLLYTVGFTAQPWAYAQNSVTDSISGNGTLSLAIGTESRKTYPLLTVASTVTAFTATDGNRTIEFVRGVNTGIIRVDCAQLRCFRLDNAQNTITSMENLNFGLYYDDGTGTYDITVTGYAGSGSIAADMFARYEF